MPENEDRYPAASGRRRFVKGVVGASALGATGITATVSANLTTTSAGAGGGAVQYYGIENTDGPAPRGLPQIPVEVDDEGYLKGIWPEVKTQTVDNKEVQVAEMQLGGTTYSSEWFQYCGIQTYPGVRPDADQSNFFRSASSSGYEWQSDVEAGAKLSVSDFDDYETWGNDIGKSGSASRRRRRGAHRTFRPRKRSRFRSSEARESRRWPRTQTIPRSGSGSKPAPSRGSSRGSTSVPTFAVCQGSSKPRASARRTRCTVRVTSRCTIRSVSFAGSSRRCRGRSSPSGAAVRARVVSSS